MLLLFGIMITQAYTYYQSKTTTDNHILRILVSESIIWWNTVTHSLSFTGAVDAVGNVPQNSRFPIAHWSLLSAASLSLFIRLSCVQTSTPRQSTASATFRALTPPIGQESLLSLFPACPLASFRLGFRCLSIIAVLTNSFRSSMPGVFVAFRDDGPSRCYRGWGRPFTLARQYTWR